MFKSLICRVLIIVLPAVVLAQDGDTDRQWVTDKLRLSLYREANDKSQVIKYLSSGDALDVEQISGAYALVTAPDGNKGWVKRGFLEDTPTSSLLLAAEQEKSRALQEEIDRLANSKIVLDQYEQDMDAMVAQIQTLQQNNETATSSIAQLRDEIEERDRALQMRGSDNGLTLDVLSEAARHYWGNIAAVVLGLLLVVVVITKFLVEHRIRKRFHGIKIW